MSSRAMFTVCAALALTVLMATGARADQAGEVNQVDGVALHGFDPVAYFKEHKAVKGEAQMTAVYKGVTYEFASKEDQAEFQANPEKYVPQYGGFCAFAVAKGVKADIDPHEFAIHDDKLYLYYRDRALQAYEGDVKGNTESADHNWPEVAKQSKIIH